MIDDAIVLPPQTNVDTEGDTKARTAELRRQAALRQASESVAKADRAAAAAWVQQAVEASERRKTNSIQQVSGQHTIRPKQSSATFPDDNLYEDPPKRKWYQKLLRRDKNEN